MRRGCRLPSVIRTCITAAECDPGNVERDATEQIKDAIESSSIDRGLIGTSADESQVSNNVKVARCRHIFTRTRQTQAKVPRVQNDDIVCW